MKPFFVFLALWAAWNLYAVCLMAADKSRARKKMRRVREKVLLGSAFVLGGVGIWLGMYLFRHKTLHKRFVVLVPIFAVLNIAAVYGMYRLLG